MGAPGPIGGPVVEPQMRGDRFEPLAAGPAHRRRMRMDAAPLAVFPDGGIRLERELRGLFAERLKQAKQIFIPHARQPPVEEHGRRCKNHAAVGVVLVLRDGRVADAHRPLAAIALQIGQDALIERIGGDNAVDRLQLADVTGHDRENVGNIVFHGARRADTAQ